jgi:hypothetical protein
MIGSCRSVSWSFRSSYPSAAPEHALTDHRAHLMPMPEIKAADHASRMHPANRSTRRIARSLAPRSKPPASDVIAPPSKAATTSRPATRENPNRSRLDRSPRPLYLRVLAGERRAKRRQQRGLRLAHRQHPAVDSHEGGSDGAADTDMTAVH